MLVAAQTDAFDLTNDPDSLILEATIKKGLKKRVVTVEATVTTSAPITFEFWPTVNGIPVGPAPAHGDLKFSGALGLSASGVWWLDLDAAELAHPGLFVGKPLVVQLRGSNFSLNIPTASVTATMIVRLEKR